MESIPWLPIVTYVFCVLIVILFVTKLRRYARISTHLRWELYPLAGEKHRPWGGSYLEEPEWWNNPPEEKSFLEEMKFMAREVAFFRDYFRLNRDYWYFVYPFHIGLFLYLVFLVLLFVGAMTMLGDVLVSAQSANVWGRFVYYITLVAGGASLVLGTIGCISLLIRRKTDGNLKPYTKRKDYFSLLFILAFLCTGFFSWVLVDHGFGTAREYMLSFFTFSSVESMRPVMVAHIILLLLLATYMPFTNMMHFFAKWFTYHKVRWDDAPNLRGSNVERSLESVFSQQVSWAAPHAKSIMCWSDLAQGTTEEEHAPRFREG